MRITDADVTYVAGLANLELTAEEHQRMVRDLNSILDYIDRLNQLDTTNVPPMSETELKSADALRDDELGPCLPPGAALANAPDTDGKFFKVPKVIDK
jgi:aspartyl-tRNA(Asn)/glutamyl-tRNA(Gln) amidotransferase subunit C